MAIPKKFVSVMTHISKNEYPYSRLRLMVDYAVLLFRSAYFHKFISPFTNDNQVRNLSFLGLKISFTSYRQLIDLIEEIFIFQEYRRSTADSRPLIIDAGSNIGLSVLYFKKLLPASKILAFEPDPVAFNLLVKNIHINRIADVVLYNCALCGKQGELTLYVDENYSEYLSIGKAKEKIVVRAEMLSAVLSGNTSFIKIDVEGSEIDIIDDLISTGKIGNIEEMVIEYHPHITNIPVGNFISKIEGSGFKCSGKQSSFRPRAKCWLINCVRI